MTPPLAEIKLYEARPEELSRLRILAASWPKKEFWSFEEIQLSLRIPGTFLLYTSSGDHWSGLALGRMFGTAAELFYIHVEGDARQRGLGRALLETFLAHAATVYAAEEVFLEVRPSNVPAQKLYKNLGFEEQGRRKRYYEDGEDALVFAKRLSPRAP